MSRGFVKEDDQEELPFVAPRAHLPANTPNYVTVNGKEELLKERETYLTELKNLQIENEKELRIAITTLERKIQMVEERISTAQITNIGSQLNDEIRFGNTVIIEDITEKKSQKFQIVGVDEADIKKQKIAFTSPLAKSLLHKKINETVIIKLPLKTKEFKVITILKA